MGRFLLRLSRIKRSQVSLAPQHPIWEHDLGAHNSTSIFLETPCLSMVQNLLGDFIAANYLSQVEKLDLQRTEYALFPSLIHQVNFAITIVDCCNIHQAAINYTPGQLCNDHYCCNISCIHILTCIHLQNQHIWRFTSGGFQHAHVRRQGVPEERLPRSLLLLLQCQTYSGQVSSVAAW